MSRKKITEKECNQFWGSLNKRLIDLEINSKIGYGDWDYGWDNEIETVEAIRLIMKHLGLEFKHIEENHIIKKIK